MYAIVHDWNTEIFLNDTDVKEFCKPGAGADTCVWLCAGAKGFKCLSKNRPGILVDRWRNGDTHAKRDGCERVNNFSPIGLEGEIPL